jgi:hypothetical protein
MKLLRSNRGQLLIYFLVIMSVVALGLTAYFQARVGQIRHLQRGNYIDELIGECRSNAATIEEAQYSGWGTADTIGLHNRALLNFIKVKNKVFLFSTVKIKEWVVFQKTLTDAGMLVDSAEPPQIEAAYLQDVQATFKDMIPWLNKAKANDNNFLH